MSVADDLTTLRDCLTGGHSGRTQRGLEALSRAEDEIARLTEEQKVWHRRAHDAKSALDERALLAFALGSRAETAESEVARLRDGLREMLEALPQSYDYYQRVARSLLAEDEAE